MAEVTSLYVIGPVSGIEDDNRAAFEEARTTLEASGYRATIPHDVIPTGTPWDEAMRLSIAEMARHDGVAMLPGVETSRGARIELRIASVLADNGLMQVLVTLGRTGP